MAQCPANKAEKRDIFHNLKRLAPVINQLPTWVPTRDSWPHRSVSCSTACYCINRLFFFLMQKSACMYFSRGNHFHQKKPMVFVYTCFLNTPVQLQWYGLFLYRSIFVWCDLVQVGCESVCRVCVYRERIWPQIVSMWVWWTQARGKRQRLSVPSQVSQSGFSPTHYRPGSQGTPTMAPYRGCSVSSSPATGPTSPNLSPTLYQDQWSINSIPQF